MKNKEATIKRRSAVLAGLLVLVMLLTGTWAWQSFDQRAFAPAYGRSNFGGRLHDDYDGYDIGAHNKNIYAENFGEHDLYVRVQLREYLALGGTPVGADPSTISIDNPYSWPIYHSAADDVTTRRAGTDAASIGEKGIEWAFGGSKTFMPTFNQAVHRAESIDSSVQPPFDHYAAYRMTSTTGNAVDAIADGFYIADMTSAADILDQGSQTGLGNGSHNYWESGEEIEGQILSVDDTGRLSLASELTTHTAKSTLPPQLGGFMTMEEWLAHAELRPTGNFWVLDIDGWFYWASPLPAKEATSLLLNGITINEQRQDWEYVVTAVADFATVSDVKNMPDLSDDAKELWNIGDDEAPGITIPTYPGDLLVDPETETVWRVLVPDDGYGNALIITEYVHLPDTPYHSNPGFTYYRESDMRKEVDNWFNDPTIVGSSIRAQGVSYEFQDNSGQAVERNELGAGIEVNREPGSAGIASTAVPVTTNFLRGRTRALAGTAEPFVLSTSEANQYFEDNFDRRTRVVNTSTDAVWSLRSPAGGWGASNSRHSFVSNHGGLFTSNATETETRRGVRPALWIRR